MKATKKTKAKKAKVKVTQAPTVPVAPVVPVVPEPLLKSDSPEVPPVEQLAKALNYMKHHTVHFLHHAPYCIIMCTAYHVADVYFGITKGIFWMLGSSIGVTFAP